MELVSFLALWGCLALGFESDGFASGNAVILHSCNGLYLCTNASLDKYEYYVYNPSIDLYKMLPHNSINLTSFMKLTFSPTKSPHYKVVIAGSDGVSYSSLQIATYSREETGNWSVCGDQCTVDFFEGFGNGVYWNSAFHWINFFIDEKPFHFKLDIVNHPVLTTIKTIEALKRKVSRECNLFESGGCMFCLSKDCSNLQLLNVYMMRNEYSKWSLEYFVNLDDIMRPFPQTWMISSDVWSIVLGERGEDSFMVI